MAERPERVEIGFSGGQALAARIADDQLKQLRKELSAAGKSGDAARWYDVETEDGSIALDLRQVAFIRTAAPAQRVGFTVGA